MASRGSSVWRAAVLAVMLACAGLAVAQVPQTLHYQGYLTSNTGAPVNGATPLTFKLYDAQVDGNLLWSETHGSVNVANGNYQVILGNTTPFGLSFSAPYWLGVTVDGDAETAPRQALSMVPYAYRAVTADNVAPGATIQGSQITGSVRVGTDTGDCDASKAGVLRWDASAKIFSACNGVAWTQLASTSTYTFGNGSAPSQPGQTCKTLKQGFPAAGTGIYWIDPDGYGGVDPYEAYCDMVSEGGGWTLWANLQNLSYGTIPGRIDTVGNVLMDQARYAVLYAQASEFKARGASSGLAYYLSKAEAILGNCHNMAQSAPMNHLTGGIAWGNRIPAGPPCNGYGGGAFLRLFTSGSIVLHWYGDNAGGAVMWHFGAANGPQVGQQQSGEQRVEFWIR